MPLPFFRPKDAYITCRDRDDGGGAQVSARISTMILARLKGLTYAHTPLSDVAHAPAGVAQETWARDWEDFFNLGAGEASAGSIPYPERAVAKPHRFFPRSRHLHVVAHCHKVTDHHPEAWGAIAPDLAEKYELSPKPGLDGYADSKVQIAVHLRRGDVGSSGRFSERYTGDEVVLERLEKVLQVTGKEGAKIRLFSEGDPADFQAFADLGADLHLNDDVFETFHHFVKSDLLFLAKSTFSYLGGVIGRNACVYEPFWHPKLPGWLSPDELDGRRIEAALNSRR